MMNFRLASVTVPKPSVTETGDQKVMLSSLYGFRLLQANGKQGVSA